MGTMGLMSAAVGYDCSECHINAGTEKVNWAADNGRKIIARKMVTMVEAINRDNFQGRQVVTCWSCHHGRDRPSTTPAMEISLRPASLEMDDALTQMPGQPSSDEIINKYIQALGGEQKLAAIKSYVATGTSVGFGGFGGGGKVHIYAKYPNQRTMLIQFAADRQDAATKSGLQRPYRLDDDPSRGAYRLSVDRSRTRWRVARRPVRLPGTDQTGPD